MSTFISGEFGITGMKITQYGDVFIQDERTEEKYYRVKVNYIVLVEKKGKKVYPEIMIPLAMSKKELEVMKEIVVKEHDAVEKEHNVKIEYKFGTMIELPRAAVLADQLSEVAQFFSFGTNDLTQTTFGISRDDFTYHDTYKKLGILDSDPFAVLDQEGVGLLIKGAVEKGRKTRPDIKLGPGS